MKRVHLAVFVLMLGLVMLYTWPLVSDPAHLFPDNPDPRTLTWVTLTVFRNLLTQPGALLHGNAFYPHGLSLTFTEPLVVPALVAGPLHALTGNPILAHNVTLLLFWAFSGWAMYAVALWVTGDHAAALVAALIFTLCLYRTENYLEFQMEMTFGIPLAVYSLVRFLETQRARYLAAFCLVFWLQAISVLYYAIILAFGLGMVTLQYAALRWSGWRARAVLLAAAAGALLGVGLVPVMRSFLVTRSELGFERRLSEAVAQSAELLTYVELRGNRLYPATVAGYYYETSLFLGGIALLLVAVGLLWLRRARAGAAGWPERLLPVAILVAVVLAGFGLATGAHLPRALSFSVVGVAILGLLLAGQLADGWRRRQQGLTDRRLATRDWVLLLLGLAIFAFLLSLGPIVRLAGRPIGPGLYVWLYPYVLPLRAIRGATRFGVLVVFAGALLAAFGVTWLRAHLPRRSFAAVAAALAILLLLEYATFPLAYGRVAAVERPVDAILRRAPADTVVLEWPAYVPQTDADAMLRSTVHGKRVVNGYSGFVPRFLSDLSKVLTDPGPPFPTPAAEALLRRVHPLNLLVVRTGDKALEPAWREQWQALRLSPPPFLRFRGSHGDEDLWELHPAPERGMTVERWVSFDFLRQHPVLRARLRPLAAEPGLEQWAAVLLNGRVAGEGRIDLGEAVTATLSPPYFQARPNTVGLRFQCRRSPETRDARYRIGATGATSPLDIRILSAGQPYGNATAITVGCLELSPNRRGYNLVALRPEGGVHTVSAFDTFYERGAAAQLAAFVGGLPNGMLVAGAVRDEASNQLTAEAVTALRALGVATDLRGRFRESHAFVGVKGAPPGTALEAAGPRALTLTVGQPPEVVGFELLQFALERPTGRR